MSGTTRRRPRRRAREDREAQVRLGRMARQNDLQAEAARRNDKSCQSCGREWGCNCQPIDGLDY